MGKFIEKGRQKVYYILLSILKKIFYNFAYLLGTNLSKKSNHLQHRFLRIARNILLFVYCWRSNDLTQKVSQIIKTLFAYRERTLPNFF